MNFIIIMADTFRFDNLACYTHLRPRLMTPKREVMTPNLDRLAEVCTIFDRAYLGAFPTVPNRKDIFKGRSTFPFDDRWAPLEPDAITFIAELGNAGYETMTVQDCPHLIPKQMGFERDFDGYLHIPGQEGYKLASWQAEKSGDESKTRATGQLWQHLANIEVTRRSEEDCFSAQTLRQAAYWLERKYRRDPQGKFLLYLDCFDPHEPWDAPQWYEDLYSPGWQGEQTVRYPGPCVASAYTRAEIAHMRGLYAAEVTMVDRWIGHLLQTAEMMGLLHNTCIIFTSDHGYYLGEHGLIAKSKGLLYEEITHIPLLVHLPGQTRARHAKPLVQPCDLAPTILDLAGVEAPSTMFGHSLRPLLDGSHRQMRTHAFSAHFMPAECPGGDYRQLTITSRDWALLFPQRADRGRPRLYHVKTDPLQKRDVLRENLPQARKMHGVYAKWLAEIQAPAKFGVPCVC